MSKAEAIAELAKLGRHADARQLAALMVAIKALERAVIHKYRNRRARKGREGGARELRPLRARGGQLTNQPTNNQPT